jgi:hypothetical protein
MPMIQSEVPLLSAEKKPLTLTISALPAAG